MDSIEGFILAGGQSRRMGTDKSRLIIEGQSFGERIAHELAPVTSSQKIVGGWPVAEFESVPDIFPKVGALGGVHAALAACSAPWALIVACDFPLVTTELFTRLASFRESFEAVAPIQRDQIPQPLCALYRLNPSLRQAEQLIKSGERRPVALLQSLHTRWVSFGELSDLNGSHHFFDNINTPHDYERLSEKGFTKNGAAKKSDR